VETIDVTGDLVRAAAALPPADHRLIATNRPDAGGKALVVVGRAADGHNLAIDAVRVEGDRIWFAVATDGPARDVRVRVGADVRTVPTGEGVWAPFATSLAILDDDNYDGDDRVDLRPLALVARDETGSRFVRAALFGAGTAAAEGDGAEPDLVVTRDGGDPVTGVVRGADCVAAGPFEGLLLDECAWSGVRARPGDGPLLHPAGALAAWLDARTFWIGPPVRPR
jgi:hypothetical protein